MDEPFKKWPRKPPRGALSVDEFDDLFKKVGVTGPFKVYRVYHEYNPGVQIFEINKHSRWESPARRAWIKCNIISPTDDTADHYLFFPDDRGFNVRFVFKNYWFAYAYYLQFKATLTP